jgi:hypothetical protein
MGSSGNVPVLDRIADCIYTFHIGIEWIICGRIGNEDLVEQVEHFGVESYAVPGERVADCEFIVDGGCGHSWNIELEKWEVRSSLKWAAHFDCEL